MKIAIVGAGISGLLATHLLARAHEVVLFEANDYAGGHSNTVRVNAADGDWDVDTGFIVMNDRNYPTFTRLLERLGVATQPTHMGFSVKSEHDDFEYAGTPRGLFCQARNAVRPAFLRMVADLLRFNRELRELMAQRPRRGEGPSLGAFLDEGGYSTEFVDRLIVPQASAVWSADPASMSEFPVTFLGEFFANHGMLGFRDRPAWATVSGGSARYVERLTAPLGRRLRLSTPVQRVTRHATHVEVSPRGGETERFDEIVFACHSDQALAMLADAGEQERRVLGAIAYQRNEALLHTDRSMLPRRRPAWQAWNFHLLAEPAGQTTITYYMNHLQRLRARDHYCVTLNMSDRVDPARVIAKFDYSHPVFTPAAVDAQQAHATISGVNRTSYCGAYWGWGFHEDGARSALRACERFGVEL